MVCTPLFLKEEPQIIGTILASNTAWRNASNTSRSVIVSGASKNFSIKLSSYSATDSSNFSLHSVASSIMSAGIGTSVKVIPLSCSFQTIPFQLIRSTTPLKFSSAPIGNCNGIALLPSMVFTCLTTFKKSAPERSILLTKPKRATL